MALIKTLARIGMEPPLRHMVRTLLRYWPTSVVTRSLWDVSSKPQYLLGVLTGAQQALKQGQKEMSAIEFGVAGGRGLLALEREAAAVEAALGVRIKVYGFDMGSTGLPSFVGDHRDHPDRWKPGDYPMDEAKLRARLTNRTTLILGNVRDTVPAFFNTANAGALGFVSFDLDLFSSTRDALMLFTSPEKRMLWHVPLYFDDIGTLSSHRFAGELLAIEEFNAAEFTVKIDQWRGVKWKRPFPEAAFLDKLYVAHDLEALGRVRRNRRRVASHPL